jgi:asparagine synthase (glutamine-hydrolysing)
MEGAFTDLVEPVGDAASLATWLLLREARPHATVFLCGHGGDAILGGYRLSHDRFRLAAMARMAWIPGGWADRFFDRHTNGAEAPDRRRRLLKSSGRFVPAAARYMVQRPLPYRDACELLGGPPLPEPYLKTVDYLYSGCSVQASILDRAQEVMVKTALANCILSWSDSMSAAFSTEMRMPFLDRDLVDLVMGLPSRARVSRWPGEGNTKRILRWWARGRVPEQVRTAPPKPFPYGALRRVLASFREEIPDRILEAPALRRALPGLEDWLRSSAGTPGGRRGRALWSLLALGVWLEAAGAD